MNKGHIPAGAEFDQPADEFFERTAMQQLAEKPSSAWSSAVGIWIGLKKCQPATRRRILVHALRLCSERGQPVPIKLVDLIESELGVSMVPRARAKDAGLKQKVAHHLVRHPRDSHRKIADALDQPSQAATIRRLLIESAEFWRLCAEESIKFDDERKYDIYEQHVRRFGSTFEYATEDLDFVALSDLVPLMLDALEGRAQPLNNEMVRDVAAKRTEVRSEAALKARLLPVAQ